MLKEVFKISGIGAIAGILLGLICVAFIEPTTSQGSLLVILILTLIGAVCGATVRALIGNKTND